MNDTAYRLLALCARAQCDVTCYQHLAQEAARLREWEEVPAQAEAHGMAPLFYAHCKAAAIELPLAAKRELQGLTLRHRHANQVRTRALHDILDAFQAAGIPALVLKGAALCHLVYPKLGLRPMSDLDILVPESEARRAQRLLSESGFNAPLPAGPGFPHRHLTGATLQAEGIVVTAEIHIKLFGGDFDERLLAHLQPLVSPISRPIARVKAPMQGHMIPGQISGQGESWMALAGLTVPPLPFLLGELTAYALGYEDMLGHLCLHLTSHVNMVDFARLIWVADIVSFAERFVSAIDWERVQRQCPFVLDTLSLLHFTTPLSDDLLSVAPIKIGPAPGGIGVEYQGWPRTWGEGWRSKGYCRVLRDTLFPSEWWLRMRYQLGSTRPLFWYRWLHHPLYILRPMQRELVKRLVNLFSMEEVLCSH